jgi:peptidoglycan/LPS O-acetylase OafA/YrhL
VSRSDDRLPALDGLRGLAAVAVLLWHVGLAGVAAFGVAAHLEGSASGPWAWMMDSPASVVWAGPEWVTVFFVLSAFVLTRAALAAGTTWRTSSYLAARLVRLYLPVWGAVLPALALALVVARPATSAGGNLWLEKFGAPVTPEVVAHSLSLAVPIVEAPIDGSLWSLHWEVLFSLALPLLVAGAAWASRRATFAVAVVAVSVLAVLSSDAPGAATYLPPFALGVVLAWHEDALAALRGRSLARLIAPLALLLLTADRWLPGATRGAAAGGVLVMTGATLAVIAPLVDPRCATLLTSRPFAWLGRRSFSLYLVHEPIVITLAFALKAPPVWALAPLAIPLSLAAAAGFHRVVERPAQALSRDAAAAAAARRRPAAAATVV